MDVLGRRGYLVLVKHEALLLTTRTLRSDMSDHDKGDGSQEGHVQEKNHLGQFHSWYKRVVSAGQRAILRKSKVL